MRSGNLISGTRIADIRIPSRDAEKTGRRNSQGKKMGAKG
jgi:hypothetical protein